MTLQQYAGKVAAVRMLQRRPDYPPNSVAPINRWSQTCAERELDRITDAILAPPIVPNPDDENDIGPEFL